MAEVRVEAQRGYAGELLHNRKFLIGTIIFLALLAAALVGNFFVDPVQRRTGSFPARLPPGPGGLLGTDSLGRSIAIQMS